MKATLKPHSHIITGLLLLSSTLTSYNDKVMHQKRNSLEQKAREHRRILSTINEESCAAACDKIEDIDELLQDLNAASVKEARETLKDLRIQMNKALEAEKHSHSVAIRELTQIHAQEIQKIHGHYAEEIQKIKSQKDYSQNIIKDIEHIMRMLNADSIQEILEKIQELKSVTEQLELIIEQTKKSAKDI